MKRNLLTALGIYVLCVMLATSLWQFPNILALCYLCVSVFVLWRWYSKSNLILYFVAFVLGPMGEIFAVHGGAWGYSKSLFLIPIWLPFVWGITVVIIKKVSETISS
jgi:hypothetical protein